MKMIKLFKRNFGRIGFRLKDGNKTIFNSTKYKSKRLVSFNHFYFTENVDKDGFPLPNENDYDDPDDLFINIGPPEQFKGMLVICPTPIGNLNDLTVRQLEALKNGDILACEDTRKTGKLLELIKKKKMKEKFFDEFGISFDEFINKGGLDMTDEQIEKSFSIKKKKEENEEKEEKENENEKTSYNDFYLTKQDKKEEILFEEKLNRQEQIRLENLKKIKLNDPLKSEEEKFKIALNLSKENYAEKPQALDKELPDPINEKYYTYVKDSEDFRERLNIIQNSEEKIAEYIDPIAENYEKELHISYKLKQKAKFIMGLTKKKEEFNKEKDETTKKKETKTSSGNNNDSGEATEREKIKARFENNSHLEEELEEYLSLELGLSDNMFFTLQKKIKQEKESKGRGLLISFNQENEEKRIPKLIKAMKLGLRVTLVSNAGTPTISDPGFKLVKETSKNGILIEPLPGPVAAITALSASSMPTDKFLFIGFLSKSSSEKITKLKEVKNIGFTSIFYENPTRLIKTVEAMKEVYGEKHNIYIGIELTKKFETHFYGRLSEIIPKLEEKYNKDNAGIRGEVTIILAPVEKVEENDKNFINETISMDLLEFAKIVNTSLKLPSNSFADFLVKTCKISNKKASAIINHIRYSENKLLKEIKSFKGVQIPNIGVKEEEFINNLKEKKTSKLFKNLKIVKEPNEKFRKDENYDL